MIVKKEYPTKYFCRGAGGSPEKSDKALILANMSNIPNELKDQVSNEYEKIFGNGRDGRREKANDYLFKLASEFYGMPCDKLSVNGCYGQLLDNVRKEVDKKTYTAPESNSKPKRGKGMILEMAGVDTSKLK